MRVAEFGCPACRARLRLKLEQRPPDSFDCPDCGTRLTIKVDPDGKIEACSVPEASAADAQADSAATQTDAANSTAVSNLSDRWAAAWEQIRTHPSQTAWTLVSAVAVLLAIWILWPEASGEEAESESVEDLQAQVAGETHDQGEVPQGRAAVNDPGAGTEQAAENGESESVSAVGTDSVNTAESDVAPQTANSGDLSNPLKSNTGPLGENTNLEQALNLVSGILNGIDTIDPVQPASESDPALDVDGGQLPGEGDAEQIVIDPPVTLEQFQASLETSLLEYRQAQPVPIREQLYELEELLDVKFVLDESLDKRPADWLARPMLITLEKCTLDDILRQVLEEADLKSEFRDGKLYLSPATLDSKS